ncbi:helix-turn-helix domain-containing protein [Nonomuraea soli]|uniref:Transcriptional regulator with XRE-family HTH domain n=1 Tax=Nonomuraea soli TaxID=1032476 RepID=A0A7W0HPX0_9ACTN|nr:helix-turn-helix transcriptional regulator [Nonomuraea soli]MBA2891324.1 transcriptional regulator with XRE-family HTH domain [Nonomuraea soli]
MRTLRERRKMTGRDVAKSLRWSASKVSRIESSTTMPSADDIEALAELFELNDDKLGELLSLLRDADEQGWWEEYGDALPQEFITFLGLEAEAIEHRGWEPQLVPGLLQTEDYAREVIQSTRAIARLTQGGVRSRVEARMDRQQRLLKSPDPPQLQMVLDESVLIRQFGTPKVMREQLEYLLEQSLLPHVSVQVLSLDGKHPVNTGAFVHLIFNDLDDAVYLESLMAARFVEGPELVAVYELAFEHLRATALSEEASRNLIKLKLEMWR